MTAHPARPRATKDMWLNAAYDLLICDGIEAVKVMPLAKRLNLTRTGFYWYFQDISELHAAMITRWESRNTAQLVARCRKQAISICEALFNLMDCWLDPALFDAPLDLAIRNWARVDEGLSRRLAAADAARIGAIADMFARHGYTAEQSEVRSLTVVYTQIGYISMQVQEPPAERLARVRHYVELFAGSAPADHEVEAFLKRHR
ncbi:TetR/AcrR family transcriptional regulator [uncultured Sulfitobacter sp.]|uniref:TetR/AcrR family transcriptional regulator n=1 Tax=uncultured Sulfitobacter sp. TaxID=191468 RepID=UPI0026193631|nr:TetR/AcrR family transcriptional regulator [uncultured Sulfitobacter sp.]